MKIKISSLHHSLFWRAVLDLTSRGTFYLIKILIARTLTLSDFGKFSYAVSLAQVFYIFTDMGIHLLLMKEQGEQRGRNELHWLFFLQIKMILCLVTFIVFCILVPFVWKWEHSWLAVLALVWMFSNSLLDFLQFVCNGLGRMDLARKTMILHRVPALLGFVVPMLFSRTLSGMLIGAALGGIVGSFFSLSIMQRGLSIPKFWKENMGEWKRIFTLALPTGISGAFGAWYLRIGTIFLGWIFSTQIVGEYSAAFCVFEITYIVPAAIMSIGVPHLAEALTRSYADFKAEFVRILKVMLPFGLAWGLFLFLFREKIIHYLFGERFQEAVSILMIFSVVGVFIFLNYAVTLLMPIFNKQRRHVLHQALVFLACLTCSVVLIPMYGGIGAALSILLAESALFALTTGYLHRHISLLRKNGGVA